MFKMFANLAGKFSFLAIYNLKVDSGNWSLHLAMFFVIFIEFQKEVKVARLVHSILHANTSYFDRSHSCCKGGDECEGSVQSFTSIWLTAYWFLIFVASSTIWKSFSETSPFIQIWQLAIAGYRYHRQQIACSSVIQSDFRLLNEFKKNLRLTPTEVSKSQPKLKNKTKSHWQLLESIITPQLKAQLCRPKNDSQLCVKWQT